MLSRAEVEVLTTCIWVAEVPADIRDYTVGQEPESQDDCCDVSAEESPIQGGRDTQIHK
jgi:hypothetical protein